MSNSAEFTTEQRKEDHIRINLEENVQSKLTTGLEKLHFMHCALPEIDLADVDTTTTLLGKTLKTPLLVSSMTGGTARAEGINRQLAAAAQEAGMAIGVGSQRAAVEDPALAESYWVRDIAPDVPLYANVGAVQMNYGFGLLHFQRAIEMIEADALILHFNALQEATQPEGDGNFSNLLPQVEKLCKELDIPVIAKEVGWGFSKADARRLADVGISAIDVAGAGGTSWSEVEMYRAPTAHLRRVAGAFTGWGIPTADSIRYCKEAAPDLPIIASGGLKTGIDVAKCIALGATAGGLAGEFLKAADQGGTEGAIALANAVTHELKITMFCTGSANLEQLSQTQLFER